MLQSYSDKNSVVLAQKKYIAISEHTKQIAFWVFALALSSARKTLLQISTGVVLFSFERYSNITKSDKPPVEYHLHPHGSPYLNYGLYHSHDHLLLTSLSPTVERNSS